MYIVTMSHTYDSGSKVVGFENRKTAEAYLHWWWEDFYNDIIATHPEDYDERYCYHEDDYAQIEYIDGERTTFTLSLVEFPSERFFNNGRY